MTIIRLFKKNVIKETKKFFLGWQIEAKKHIMHTIKNGLIKTVMPINNESNTPVNEIKNVWIMACMNDVIIANNKKKWLTLRCSRYFENVFLINFTLLIKSCTILNLLL